MTFNLILVLVMGVLCYFVLPFIIWCCVKNEKAKNILTTIFFCMYLLVLFAGVFGKIGISSKNVSVSFDFGGEWFAKRVNTNLDIRAITKFDLCINIAMLLPVGMFVLYLSRKRKWWLKLLFLLVFGVVSGCFIEFMQYALPIHRSVQITDVLLNTISVVIGGLIAWLYLFVIKKIRKSPTL